MTSLPATFEQYKNSLPVLGRGLSCVRVFGAYVLLAWMLLGFQVEVREASAQEYNSTRKSGSLWLNPFKLSNSDNRPVAAPRQQRGRNTVASDSRQQQTVQIQHTSRSQARNPLAWSNEDPSAETAYAQDDSYESRPSITSRISKSLPISDGRVEVPNPLSWSNEAGPTTNASSLNPPQQVSFSEAVQQALRWQDGEDENPDPRIVKSRPPENATDAQLVEWEKEHYPWARPFYWSEPEFGTPEALALEPDPEFSPAPPTGAKAALLAKPFFWTNQPVAKASRPAQHGGARSVAYLQSGEELPLPPQLARPPETLPQGDESTDNALQLSKDGEDEKGAIGQAETLGREPVDTSLQFLRADTVLLKPGEAQWDYGFAYTLFDQTLPVVIQTSSTTARIELARFRRREMILPLELRYGLARRIQLFLNVPFGWSNTEFAFQSFDAFENTGGIGDIIFGGTFLLRQGNHECTDVIMTLACTAPTGQDPFAPVVGLTPSAPALGGGTWSLASNLLFVRNYDPIVLFYGVGTRQHFLRKVNNLNYRAGGEYNYQMGVGFAVNEKVTFSTRFSGAYVSESRIDGERIKGSIQEPMTVGLALTVAKDDRLIEPFIDFGLTNDSVDARFGITWTR